jgi:hypothetical protein
VRETRAHNPPVGGDVVVNLPRQRQQQVKVPESVREGVRSAAIEIRRVAVFVGDDDFFFFFFFWNICKFECLPSLTNMLYAYIYKRKIKKIKIKERERKKGTASTYAQTACGDGSAGKRRDVFFFIN